MGKPKQTLLSLIDSIITLRLFRGVTKNLIQCLLCVVVVAGLSSNISAQVGRNADVILISERVQATPGEEFYLALDMRIKKDWHVYWKNPGDAGLSPRINWLREPKLVVGGFVWPVPKELLVKEDEIMDYGYEDKLVLPFKVRIPEGAVDEIILRGEADYLICKKVCIPEITPVQLRLLIGDRSIDNFSEKEEIDQSLASVPTKLVGSAILDQSQNPWLLKVSREEMDSELVENARFFPYGHEIIHAAEQNAVFIDESLVLQLRPSHVELSEPLAGVLVFEHFNGKRLGYEIQANYGTVRVSEPEIVLENTNSTVPTISMAEFLIICFLAFIGGLILNLMPCVLPVLFIKAFGILKEARTGQSGRLKYNGVIYTLGVIQAFTLVCAGFLLIRKATGTANLGYQLQEPWIVSILAVIMFFIGLWLAGLFEFGSSVQNIGSKFANQSGTAGTYFSGILAALVGAPCVGPFLGVALGAVVTQPSSVVVAVFVIMGFGFALPFLLLSFMPSLMRILPKPGPWMETLKQLFSFPMFLTSAWLLAVLGALTDYMSVIWVFVGIVGVWFIIWLTRKIQSRIILTSMFAFLGAVFIAPLFFDPREYFPERFESVDKVETAEWSPEKVDSLISEGRGIFVDFTALWCATCQLNKQTTLNALSVLQAFGETGTVLLTADFTKKNPVISEELVRYSRPGVPMYLYYSPGSSTPIVLPEVLSRDLVIGLVRQNES